MINRGNYKLIEKYLKDRDENDQVSLKTIDLERTWLAHWLNWADDVPFSDAPKITPKFSVYLMDTRSLSNVYISKVIKAGRHFFEWVRKHDREYHKAISEAWLDTIRTPRLKPEYKEREAVTIQEMKLYARTPANTLRMKRIKASVAFWFLSGIRISAFVSLPIKSVDIQAKEIYQWPEWGVNTKNQKHETTTFFNVPECSELFKIVVDWHNYVSSQLSPESKWFCHFSPITGEPVESSQETATHRDQRARKDLKAWIEKYDLPYHSPHKFRHGIATYSMTKAKTVAQLKAISQNLMHSNISITDGIYAIYSLQEMKDSLDTIGIEGKDDVMKEILKLQSMLEKSIK